MTDLDWVMARAQVHDLIVRHAWAVDSWDAAAASGCYVKDGLLTSSTGMEVCGSEDLETFYGRGRTGGRFGTMAGRKLVSTSHVMGSILVDLADDRGTARSACTSFTVTATESGPGLVATGLRYEDSVRREPDGRWLIAHRALWLDWTCDLGRPTL